MPRPIPDKTIIIRAKGKRKGIVLQIFKKKEKIKIKVNNKWFKNKLLFNLSKLSKLIENTIRN